MCCWATRRRVAIRAPLPSLARGVSLAIWKVPFSLLLFGVMAVIFGLLLHRTPFGRMTFAIGNSEEASRYSGVPVARIKLTIYMLSGFMAALAGIVLAARFGSTRPDIGLGLELDAITATVLGGISINGGSGTMIGAVLSLILIGELRFGMGLVNVPGQVQGVVVGMLLILAILMPNLVGKIGKSRSLSGRTLAAIVGGLVLFGAAGWFFFWLRATYLASL